MAGAGNLIPLVILFVFVAAAAFVGFIVYSIATDVGDKTAKRMEKKNINFSKTGMKVGIKEVSTEDISDSTQSTLMKVWNSAAWPGYKSKLGWGSSSGVQEAPAKARPSAPAASRKKKA